MIDKNFDIVKHTFSTLNKLDVPVYFMSKKEIKPPMVLFNITSERGDCFWEDEEQVIKYKIIVNIFSRENFFALKNQIVKIMREAGFIRTDIPSCLYLEDIDMYNQPINFVYYQELN